MSKLTHEYVKQLKHLHSTTDFGSGGKKIPSRLEKYLHDAHSILDYGSGKGIFSKTVKSTYPNIEVHSYDPVTSPIKLPDSVDITYSSDVLEHVEPEYIDHTLDTLFTITKKVQYHLIACHPASKKLRDGRNAHLIIQDPEWWRNKLKKYDWTIEFEKIKSKDKIVKFQQMKIVKYIVILKNETN